MSNSLHTPYRAALAAALLVAALAGSAAAQLCADPPRAADFKKEILGGALGSLKSPIEMSVAKDGKVFIAERFGAIKVFDPATNQTTVAATLSVYIYSGQYDVGGVLGVAAAPNFPTDNWVYVYYTPKGLWSGQEINTSGKGTNRLARFKFVGGILDTATQQILIDIPVGWETHNGGSLKFGKNGDLYLSTGDNSCASCNDQYSPMDERSGRSYTDDQRSTANTNDLRGKVIRIHPVPTSVNGKYYTIPAGSLFAEGLEKTRPEIYTMGHRNPYRMFPDPVTGRLYIGEFGPAAQAASERGPTGADQIKVTDEAAFLGYPYFLKDNQPYCHWDYAQAKCVPIKGQTGLLYDPAKPVNTSPNNTGLEILPPAKPAVLWEHDGPSADPIPGLKGCGFMSGPVYHFDPAVKSKVKFPKYFDDKWIFWPSYGGWQPKLAVMAPPPAPVAPIKTVLSAPWTGINFSGGLHDMEYGPHDGALYALDYGTSMYSNNGDAGLIRISYTDTACTATGVGNRLDRKAAHAFVTLHGPETRNLAVPAGSRSVEIHSLSGKRVWQSAVKPGELYMGLPVSLGRGMFRVQWR